MQCDFAAARAIEEPLLRGLLIRRIRRARARAQTRHYHPEEEEAEK